MPENEPNAPATKTETTTAKTRNDDGHWIVTTKDKEGKTALKSVYSFPNRGRAAPVIRRMMQRKGLTVADIQPGTMAEFQKMVGDAAAKNRAAKKQPEPTDYQDTRGVPVGTEPDKK